MTAARLLRAAAVLYVVFAIGHTAGFLLFVAPTAQARQAFDAMAAATFQDGWQTFSYAGFYRGFGLCVTVLLVLCAALAWLAAGMTGHANKSARLLADILLFVQVALLATSAVYFGVPPIVLSVVILVALAVARLRLPSSSQAGSSAAHRPVEP